MGCSPIKQYNKAHDIVKVISNDQKARRLMSTAVHDGLPNTELCLQIKIKETDIEAWEVQNEVVKKFASEHAQYCIEIYEIFTKLEILLGNFEDLIHAVCIPDYNLVKGLEALLIYLNINSKSKFKLNISKNFPILELGGNQNGKIVSIVQGWNNLVKFLTDSEVRSSIERNSSKVKNALSVSLSSKSRNFTKIFKVTNKYLMLAEKTLENIEGMKKRMMGYMDNYKINSKKISSASKTMKELEGVDIFIVVHCLKDIQKQQKN